MSIFCLIFLKRFEKKKINQMLILGRLFVGCRRLFARADKFASENWMKMVGDV